MPLKTPHFWQHKDGIAQWLRPLSCFYLACHRQKMKSTKPYKSRLPVICVGGVTAGGSGKTPIVQAIITLIRELNLFENPVILTRGYGGVLRGPTLVNLAVHSARDVGDEAILHAIHAPTIVSRNRTHGAMLAEVMDADVIIMDDGLQNNSLHKDFSILVIDSRFGTGNGYVLPAGPLREPLADAQARSHLVIQTKIPHITSHHDKNKQYFGFAGIGYPEKFKSTLTENGFYLKGFKAFADHHAYTEADIKKLKDLAGDVTLITTEKDFVKIPHTLQTGIEVVRIVHTLEQRDDIIAHLKRLRGA